MLKNSNLKEKFIPSIKEKIFKKQKFSKNKNKKTIKLKNNI